MMVTRRTVRGLALICVLLFLNQAWALKSVAPKLDSSALKFKRLNVQYSYNLAKDPKLAFKDRIRLFLIVRDENVLKNKTKLMAEVKIKNLATSKYTTVKYVRPRFQTDREDELNVAYLDLRNDKRKQEELLKPSSVYRIFVNFHTRAKKYDTKSAIGYVPLPYYVATSGETQIEQARHEIVMRSFREFYYRRVGWRSNERYPMDCYAFYMWATGSRTKGAVNGRTQLGALFGSRRPYNSGSSIPKIAAKEPIHGDYVRQPGHSLMLLTYDAEQNRVWTIEGNYNSTIEVVVRSVNSGWRVGHLVNEHIRPIQLVKNSRRRRPPKKKTPPKTQVAQADKANPKPAPAKPAAVKPSTEEPAAPTQPVAKKPAPQKSVAKKPKPAKDQTAQAKKDASSQDKTADSDEAKSENEEGDEEFIQGTGRRFALGRGRYRRRIR